ncbi:MAG: hypothetical protein ACRDA8_12515 [Shewanella sp.]
MHLYEIGISESISRDMQKCTAINNEKPSWQLAHENNQKPLQVKRSQINEPTPMIVNW